MHEAVRRGDLLGLRRLLDGIGEFPDCALPVDWGCGRSLLAYAVHHGPLALVEALLALGADPNGPPVDPFPPIFAAIGCERPDRGERLRLLEGRGADLDMRGINDATPLHFAAAWDDPDTVRALLELGADPAATPRIDDFATPFEEAQRLGHRKAAAVLRDWRG